MPIREADILAVLDRCCNDFTFPMLDNGYVYLAAVRLSLFRSKVDWAIVIERFGYSVRAGLPDTSVQTFASRLHNRNSRADYVSRVAFENYLRTKPHDEFRSTFPLLRGRWQDTDRNFVAMAPKSIRVRGQRILLPPLTAYAEHGIALQDWPRVRVFELCRYLAAIHRELVLATPDERRASVRPEMEQLLQLEEWNHPDVVRETERPNGAETFQQLARVLATGEVANYRPSAPSNTHWRHWPDGGRL